MKKHFIPFLLCINVLLLMANCIREIDFSQESPDGYLPVVSGRITNILEDQVLRLTKPGPYNKQAFQPLRRATIRLSDDAGNTWVYLESSSADTAAHFYYLPDFAGVPGRSYSLHIQLEDGTIYQCAPQKLLEPVLMDSVQTKGEQYIFTRADGTVVQEPFIGVYAFARTPADGQQASFLRWDAYSVHIFNEIVKIYNPFAVQRQCFITNYFNRQNISILDTRDLQPGVTFVQKVGRRRIDNGIAERMCFNVYQLTISEAAYKYWQKASILVNPSGTIFDEPPAPLAGNVFRDGDLAQPILGWFEVAGASLNRVFLVNGQLGPQYTYINDYCQYDWSRYPPVNHPECDDCRILPGSTLAQPDYWQ